MTGRVCPESGDHVLGGLELAIGLARSARSEDCRRYYFSFGVSCSAHERLTENACEGPCPSDVL